MKLVVLGAGESGVGAALLGKDKGWDVFVSDAGPISPEHKASLDAEAIVWEENKHTLPEILKADLVVKSPGIPYTVEVIRELKKAGIAIVDEIEFAVRYTKKPIIAITGSNGKTTTATLLSYILRQAGLEIGLGGNIGTSLASLVRENNCENYVIELSSFQLEGIETFRPHIVIFTNLSEDHLDRYEYDYDKYIEAKFRIALNQTEDDYFLYDADDKDIARWLSKVTIKAQKIPFSTKKTLEQGASMDEENLKINWKENHFTMPVTKVKVQGEHNLKNAMAASTAAKLLHIRKKTIRESLESFQGVAHRLEQLDKIDKVQYINDSKATNVNAVYYALDSVKTPIVWIVGGEDKGNDYKDLLPLVNEKVKAIIALGVNNAKIRKAFRNNVAKFCEVQSMYEAVQKAHEWAVPGDTVLLSPACASFDLFKNYEDRGNQFKYEVEQLKSKK